MKDTDRELLEWAAKAAGMESMWDQPRGAKSGWFRARMPGTGPAFPAWNPLDDDGAALRLAVALKMDLLRSDDMIEAQGGDLIERDGEVLYAFGIEPLGADPAAATRRAIVRAAAEVGKVIAQRIAADLPEDNYYKSQAEAEEAGRAAAEIGKGMA